MRTLKAFKNQSNKKISYTRNKASKETTGRQTNMELLDKKFQEKGWKFFGPILHYKKAWKNQAAIYEKEGKYIVSGIDSAGKAEIHEPISKEEAEKRTKESLEEIKKHMFSAIK